MHTETISSFLGTLRYYPPEKQGLRQVPFARFEDFDFLRYYPPEKQGLRLARGISLVRLISAQILSSRKTRIKTEFGVIHTPNSTSSDTILQKNKD